MPFAIFLILSAAPRHGTWVYQIDGQPLTQAHVAALVSYAREVSITEVYVSQGAMPLSADTTRARIAQLHAAGLKVEALLDPPHLRPLVARAKALGFDAIHYDYEPWIGRGESIEWTDSLLASYQEARDVAGTFALPVHADMNVCPSPQARP